MGCGILLFGTDRPWLQRSLATWSDDSFFAVLATLVTVSRSPYLGHPHRAQGGGMGQGPAAPLTPPRARLSGGQRAPSPSSSSFPSQRLLDLEAHKVDPTLYFSLLWPSPPSRNPSWLPPTRRSFRSTPSTTTTTTPPPHPPPRMATPATPPPSRMRRSTSSGPCWSRLDTPRTSIH